MRWSLRILLIPRYSVTQSVVVLRVFRTRPFRLSGPVWHPLQLQDQIWAPGPKVDTVFFALELILRVKLFSVMASGRFRADDYLWLLPLYPFC